MGVQEELPPLPSNEPLGYCTCGVSLPVLLYSPSSLLPGCEFYLPYVQGRKMLTLEPVSAFLPPLSLPWLPALVDTEK